MKLISVPTTKEAMQRLDTDSCIDGDLIEYKLSEKDFNLLSKKGLFKILNEQLDILIDEYEDESISFEKIDFAIKAMEDFERVEDVSEFDFNDILEIFKKAKEFQTGVFFFF